MRWLKTASGVHEVLFISAEGREYKLTLRSVGLIDDAPPPLVIEQQDGRVSSGSSRYAGIHQFAVEHGCIITDFRSIDQIN